MLMCYSNKTIQKCYTIKNIQLYRFNFNKFAMFNS